MNKYIKPSSIAFYLLIFILFFVIGAALSGLSGVAKDQGLASGAIVLGYGLMIALGGIVLAIIIISRASLEKIKKANWLMFLLAIIFIAILIFRLNSREKEPAYEPPSQPKTKTIPQVSLISNLNYDATIESMGLGLFTPNFLESNVLYFFSIQNYDKPIEDNPKLDSITFSRTEYGDFQIETAPPWLQPEHLKLDYGILYFKIIRIGKDYLQIEGNSSTKNSYYVSKWSGNIIFWPEFILSTYSVEFPEGKSQVIRVKPLDYSGPVTQSFETMRPVSIKDPWLEIELLDNKLVTITKGWIKWRDESGLLITYSLLS